MLLEIDGEHGSGREQDVVLERGGSVPVGLAVPDTPTAAADRLAASLSDDDVADELVSDETELFDASLYHLAEALRHLSAVLGFVLLAIEERLKRKEKENINSL